MKYAIITTLAIVLVVSCNNTFVTEEDTTVSSYSTENTVGLILNSADSFDGYTLFAPMFYTETYLIDNCGKMVTSWSSDYKPGLSAYLLENGDLLRTGNTNNNVFTGGGSGGIIEQINPNNETVWSYEISDNSQCQHHDIEPLSNGNILVIIWELKTTAESIQAGRNPNNIGSAIYSEKIIEINPTTNNIVWEWHAWDHLVQEYDESKNNYGTVSEHPELIDINYYSGRSTNEDWLHINSVNYNEDLDQIVLSVHNFSEIWIIDHSTSTIEASSHSGGNSGRGGDLLYRWGNPQTYDLGASSDQFFFAQHDARWIESDCPDAGKIMIYNNGRNRPEGDYSTIDIIEPFIENSEYSKASNGTFLPEQLSWQYLAETPTDFYSASISGAEQLSNGNILICEGESGNFFEVASDMNTVWQYINPVSNYGPINQGEEPGGTPQDGNPNNVFRIKRYTSDYAGLSFYDLIGGEPIELNSTDYQCSTEWE